MNDKNENNESVEETNEVATSLIESLQDEVDELESSLATAQGQIQELQANPLIEVAAPAGDAELRALAVTVRTAQRSGHPDAAKHLDALLIALGAV